MSRRVSSTETSAHRTLILIGAGHANVSLIRHFAMQPDPRVRLIVVNPDGRAPYSGMLPGFLSRQYAEDSLFIDVGHLVQQAQGLLIRGSLSAIDATQRAIFIKPSAGGAVMPPIHYDVAVINTGASPHNALPSTHPALYYVKPLTQLLNDLPAIDRAVKNGSHLTVIGGGAAGIELVFAMRARYGAQLKIALVSKYPLADDAALSAASVSIERSLAERDIQLHAANPAVSARPGWVQLADGTEVASDAVLVATPVVSPQWLNASHLPRAQSGFLAVDEHLAVRGCLGLYACGDVVELETSRPRSGVMAVRAGQYLARAIPQVLRGQTPRAFVPQTRWLTLLNRGDDSAIAVKGRLTAAGGWVWRLKDRIDRQFMARFQLPPMASDKPMRCEGCAAKLPGLTLEEAFGRGFEDAVGSVAKKGARFRTLDALTYLIDDPYLMGRLAMRHAVSDLWAMGAKPKRALGLVGVTRSPDSRCEADEFALVHGGLKAGAKDYGLTLDGGHSLALEQPLVAVSVEGKALKPVKKRGVRAGDRLVISGALGSGVLLAGFRQQRIGSKAVDAWLQEALLDLREAAEVAVSLEVSAMTDVTGFGLAGHLKEMLEGTEAAFMWADSLPLMDGVAELIAAGIESTSAPANRAYAGALAVGAPHPVAVDPQTCGPLLVAVAPQNHAALLDQWHGLGLKPQTIGQLTTETS